MGAHLTVHELDGTQIGDALGFRVKKGTNTWSHAAGEDGEGRFIAKGDLPANQLAERVLVRVNDGSSDVFEIVTTKKRRRALPNPGTTEIELEGPGARWLLHRGQVLQYDTSDCAEPADERIYGWQDPNYDDGGWGRALSFGTFLSGPWQTPRPENWPASLSEYITISLDPIADETDWGARATVTLADEADFMVLAAADDEYRIWCDGTLIMDTFGGGPQQWREYQQHPMKLCSGDHTFAVQVRNLERPASLASTNYTWLQFALAPVGSDGKPLSANQQWAVYTDATGGTFTIFAGPFGEETLALDFDEDAATIQLRLEQLESVGAGNVEVTGTGNVQNTVYELSHNHTGGTFTLEGGFGAETSPLAHNATALQVETALEALITVGDNVTVTGAGTDADPWRIEFDNAWQYEDYTLQADGSGLTGGDTFTLSKTSTGDADPWLITFQGDLVSKQIPLAVDGTNLTGGTGINADEYQRGRGADAVMKSSTSWVVRDFTDGIPGLTPRHILDICLTEAQARGDTDLDHVTLAGTNTTDPTGATYPEVVLPVALPADIHRVAQLLEELGFPVAMEPGLNLKVWNPTTRGTDLSGSVSILAHTEGVTNLVAEQSETEIVNVFRVRTDEGWHEVTDATSITARGRIEDGQSLEGFASAAEAELVTGPTLENFAAPVRRTTCDINSEEGVIYDTLGLCDIATASAFSTTPDTFDEIPMRLVGITGQVQEHSIRYSVELID